ncbi:hypothetical protein EKG38_24050 [Shewanella canadensis]|uniref:Uncharacterized protein n=1 Tax=Shewanella canadensis TaxID=271096 RepID=A0A3S0KXD7_9GAMM|nr:hypothetical protein [Shewanella canadensis]RTR36473.1 hypothetical protein EKG38_24050 [Shewanella canadensis]
MYVIIWIFLSVLVGMIGSSRSIGFLPTLFISLIFSPVIGLLACLTSERNNDIEFKEKLLKSQESAAHLKNSNSENTGVSEEKFNQEKWEQAQVYIDKVTDSVNFLKTRLNGSELESSLLKLKHLYETLGENYLTESSLNKIVSDVELETDKRSLELREKTEIEERKKREASIRDKEYKAELALEKERRNKTNKRIIFSLSILLFLSLITYGVFQLGINLIS